MQASLAITVAALTVLLAGCTLLREDSAQASGHKFHVSTHGDDANPGSVTSMLRTISEAARRAGPGDLITVHEGVYRERVNPTRGGRVGRAADRLPGGSFGAGGDQGFRAGPGWARVQNDTWKLTLPDTCLAALAVVFGERQAGQRGADVVSGVPGSALCAGGPRQHADADGTTERGF